MPVLPSLSFQPYIEAPDQVPVQEYANLVQGASQRYDQNLAQADALDEHISQLGTTINNVDKPILDSLNSDTRSALSNIKQNGDWENAQVPIRMVAKRLLSDPALTIAQQNKQAVDKINALKEQAQAEGHHIIQYSDPSQTPTQNPDGSFNRITGDGVFDKKLDWMSKQKSIFEGLEANSTAYKDSSPQRDESTGQIYQIGSGSSRRYIDGKRIAQVVKDNLDNYLSTDEGQQQMKVYTTANSENSTPLDAATARERIRQQLLSEGATREFHDTSSERSERLAPAKQQPVNPNDGTTAVQDTAVPVNQDFSALKDALTKKTRMNPNSIITPGSGGLPNYAPGVLNSDPKTWTRTNGYDNSTLQNSDLYKSLSKLYGSSLGTTDPDKINPLIKNYLAGIENRTISPILHATNDPKQIKADNEFMQNGAVKLVPIYDNKTGKTYNSMEDPSFQKDFPDIKPKDYNEARVVGQYDTNHPYADVTGNDNFTTARKVSVGGHDFVAGEFAQDKRSDASLNNYLGNKITASDRTGVPISFSNGKGNMKIFSKGEGSYLVQGKGSDGKDLPLVPLSLVQATNFLTTAGYTKQQ